MPRIALLHTVDSNVAVFDAALRKIGVSADVTLHHTVRADLLAEAERAGALIPDIARRTADALRALRANAEAVLLTCSTLGPSIDALKGDALPGGAVPVLRVDTALATEAVRAGGRVVVLCAVETTLAPTRTLFEDAARATGAVVEAQLVPDAWAAFKAGDRDGYHARIAAAADAATQGGATRVALAQASMAGAADRTLILPAPLESPFIALRTALAALEA